VVADEPFDSTPQRQSPLPTVGLLILLLGFLTWPPSAIGQSPHSQQSSQRLLTHPDDVKALPSLNKRWALLIGVDRYEDSNISSLKGAANDARSLNQALVNYGGFPQDQVIVLSSDEPFERQPTRKNILRRLSNLAGLVPKDGLLLISFAGHGIDRNGQGFLIPSDATFTEDTRLLEETAISVSSVKQRIIDTGVQQVMIILDSCRSYPTGRSDSPNPLTNAFTKTLNFDVTNKEVTAFVVLYATAVGDRAYEYAEKQQGYFSWAIAQALKGAAANERGEVTLGALVKYLESTVPKLVSIDYGAKVVQRPFAKIEGYRAAELVLAVTAPNGKPVHASPGSSDAELDLTAPLGGTPSKAPEMSSANTPYQDFQEVRVEVERLRISVRQAIVTLTYVNKTNKELSLALNQPLGPHANGDTREIPARVSVNDQCSGVVVRRDSGSIKLGPASLGRTYLLDDEGIRHELLYATILGFYMRERCWDYFGQEGAILKLLPQGRESVTLTFDMGSTSTSRKVGKFEIYSDHVFVQKAARSSDPMAGNGFNVSIANISPRQ
jgi:hypothetical protein